MHYSHQAFEVNMKSLWHPCIAVIVHRKLTREQMENVVHCTAMNTGNNHLKKNLEMMHVTPDRFIQCVLTNTFKCFSFNKLKINCAMRSFTIRHLHNTSQWV